MCVVGFHHFTTTVLIDVYKLLHKLLHHTPYLLLVFDICKRCRLFFQKIDLQNKISVKCRCIVLVKHVSFDHEPVDPSLIDVPNNKLRLQNASYCVKGLHDSVSNMFHVNDASQEDVYSETAWVNLLTK